MKSRGLCSLLIGLLWLSVEVNTYCQRLRLEGSLTDVLTHKPIKTVTLLTGSQESERIKNSNSRAGQYQVTLPYTTSRLLVQSSGYRSLLLPVHIKPDTLINSTFSIPLQLIPLDQQAIDQPYFQSQQRHTVLPKSNLSRQQTTTRLIQVTDAITGKPVSGTVTLFFTKTNLQRSYNLSAGQSAEVVFTESDIIAIDVKSDGYQPYQGNLMLRDLDGSTRQYVLKLSPELTLLAIDIYPKSIPVTCELVLAASPTTNLQKAGPNQFYARVLPNSSYVVRIRSTSSTSVKQERLTLKPGFTYRVINLTQSNGLSPLKPFISITLYFDQGAYELRPEAHQQLDSLVDWLRNHTHQRLCVTGHTDNVGKPDLNQTLSDYRARVIIAYLVARGVPESRLMGLGLASSHSIAPNDHEENRRKNRRAVITLTDG